MFAATGHFCATGALIRTRRLSSDFSTMNRVSVDRTSRELDSLSG
jgi:hypothetical protein